jgi:methionyl-tRNA formyltransferase
MKKIKIGYFADGPWSHKALKRLLLDDTLQIAFVCARDDTPDPILKAKAAENGLDFIKHPKINSDEFLEWMIQYECDLFVSMSFNQIFRSALINLPALKTINCHAGKLPFYRGRNILNWALINDEKEFGITVHYVDEGIDTGDIILQRCYPISDEDDYSTLLELAYEGCATNLYDAIKEVQSDNVKVIVQQNINQLGFYCTARKEGDERLNWSQKSRDIFNFVRAICRPGPEARTYLRDMEIKINKLQYLSDAVTYKGIIGSVVGVESNAFFVKTLDSFVKVTEWSGCTRLRIGDRLK